MIKFTLPVRPRTKKNTPMILWRKQPFQIKIGKVIDYKNNTEKKKASAKAEAFFFSFFIPPTKKIFKNVNF